VVPVTVLRQTAAWTDQVATLRKQFGARLRQIRAQRRMTQERFAETLNLSVDFLSLMERGISAPSFETLERIAKRLRVPIADLFTFDTNAS
jgi:transcriptional regulator with XRE-family HTH domain